MPALRRIAERAVAVAFGLVAGVALDELALQAMSVVNRGGAAGHIQNDGAGDRPIILFAGDSNVYGVYVRPDETLPKRVEELSRRDGGNGVRCLNVGYPGYASWHVLGQVSNRLSVKPVCVAVCVGINNASQLPTDEGLGILEELRFVKLLRRTAFNMAFQSNLHRNSTFALGSGEGALTGANVPTRADGHAVAIHGREGVPEIFEIRGPADPAHKVAHFEERYKKDLREVVRRSRDAGAQVLFMNYFAGYEQGFDTFTRAMNEVAAELRVPVAPCADAFRDALAFGSTASRPRNSAEFQARFSSLMTVDRHPTALGYRVEARVVAKSLHEMGLLPAAAVDDPMGPLREAGDFVPKLRQIGVDPAEFEVEARAGDFVTLFLGAQGGSDYLNLPLPIDRMPFTKAAERDYDSVPKGAAGADGKARLTVPRALVARFEGRAVFAVAVVEHGDRANASSASMTEPLEVRRETHR